MAYILPELKIQVTKNNLILLVESLYFINDSWQNSNDSAGSKQQQNTETIEL